MDVLSFFFSAQALFFAALTLGLAIVFHAGIHYVRESVQLRLRLEKLNRQLEEARARVPELREQVEAAQRQVEPLHQLLQKMQLYYRHLHTVQRQAAAQQKPKEEEDPKAIQIHRPDPLSL